MGQIVEYGPGGFDTTKPNNNVVSTRTVPDNPFIANADALQAAALQALTANRTFIAIASPTNAQVVAQTKALSQQMNGLIRLVLGQLDATN